MVRLSHDYLTTLYTLKNQKSSVRGKGSVVFLEKLRDVVKIVKRQLNDGAHYLLKFHSDDYIIICRPEARNS